MKFFLVLLLVFTLFLFRYRIASGIYDLVLSGKVALAAMLFFTALGHFGFARGMTLTLPEFVLFQKVAVRPTGTIEILVTIGLFISNVRLLMSGLLMVFFILILPANIYLLHTKLTIKKELSTARD